MSATPDTGRRAFLGACAAAGIAGVVWPARTDSPLLPADLCAAGPGAPLPIGGETGWFARLAPGGSPVALRAGPAPAAEVAPWALCYATARDGHAVRNPTFVVERGERLRIELANALDEPTIVHWHGLTNDTANDGAGFTLAAPGERYVYDFPVRNRAGLYWYHPHPHGLSAGQAYRGLFGLIEVSDAEDRALRAALDLLPGATEFPLVLQDRRGRGYAPTTVDRHLGFFGERPTVNGEAEPWLEVATRVYRFRILNASNARTYRLGLRDGDGKPLYFTLVGTDGGLLSAPVRCEECFLSPAERIDVLIDLRERKVGETIVLETRGFDPMHKDTPPEALVNAPAATAMAGHVPAPAADAKAEPAHSAWPEGARHPLFALRVREKVDYRRTVPATLSAIPRIPTDGTNERPFRMSFNKGRWRINDRVYAMGETPIEIARGATEVWLLRNYHTSMPHAMHLHGVQFQVVERETSPDFLAPLATHGQGRLATDLGWKDTVLVWPGESVRVAIDFRLPFDAPQTYLFHCHNLEHEDGGMMLGVKVA